MISTVPISVGFAVLVGFYQLLKPRIPQYSIQVQSVFPTFIVSATSGIATTSIDNHNATAPASGTQTGSDSVDTSFLAYAISVNVNMYNDNFINIDIYSLTFDMFYPDWTTEELRHVAQITDTRQYSKPSSWSLWPSSSSPTPDNDDDDDGDDVDDIDDKTESTASTTRTTLVSESREEDPKRKTNRRRNRQLRKQPPMWSLGPRSDFVMDDTMYMALYGEASAILSLSYDSLINLGGTIHVPLTGVMHIVANGVVPVTLSIICDNELDTWSLTVNGLNCELNNLLPGWKDMGEESSRIRSKLDGTKYSNVESRIPRSESETSPYDG
mmetsp:Transcript_25783/g.61072  ORF Transcript_25783/g.61072 Transcript_25783/m.61072 type:complete len:327 (+) Transcript_25783:352-1332(+)|eukprot:CAMPEP_0113485910 /NCGR_PEP_ID=MMETSP0014_2-20120614/24725_1 /TAXON_ID=2857 /ORGANISM="Nitzschia sp." /LENGTH=326 /DNA_ID=CAMNT_0000379567 /DNA_START=277 /DNA_END=1257 /DNA_ORIENTATION=- /assembly_acc=CAM_ASM_000159